MKNTTQYIVTVKYDGRKFFETGDSYKYDRAVEKLALKAHTGSGFCFSTGKRDHDFLITGYDNALKLAKKARALKVPGLGRVTAKVFKL